MRVEIATIFELKVVAIATQSTIVYKTCKLYKAIFSTGYNIF